MTILSEKPQGVGAPRSRGLLFRFGRIVAALRHAHERDTAQRQYRHLLECEPRILDDVGLTRSDVQGAMRN